MTDSFNIHPIGYKDKVNSIFAAAGTDSINACMQLSQLINEVRGMLPDRERGICQVST